MADKGPDAPYVIWIDYGSEGWSPKGYDTPEEVLDAIASGDTHGHPFVITRRTHLSITEMPWLMPTKEKDTK